MFISSVCLELAQITYVTPGRCLSVDMQLTPLAQNPTALADFDPESIDYYQQVIVTSTWPAAIGLAAFAALLLLFAVWRMVRWCCARCGPNMNSINGPAAPKYVYSSIYL